MRLLPAALLFVVTLTPLAAAEPPLAQALAEARRSPDPQRALAAACPVAYDWLLADAGTHLPQLFDPAAAADLERALLAKVGAAEAAELPEPERLARWQAACQRRRAERLSHLPSAWHRIVFARHGPLGGSHYAYTEAQSDAQAERTFTPGASLCLLTLDGLYGTVQTLVDAPDGMIRDADVSFDGRRVLFAWKRADRSDDFHLWELDTGSGQLRQLTFGLGVADYEGCYLPDGGIVFSSTRCVQTVDCWVTEVSNLYTCDADGGRLRRLGFDQVHTNYPSLLADGRVIYTRWDYNDRGQIFPQGLFAMNPDGTGQTAFYGNNSWFPTTIAQARGIPGSDRVMAIATGHHSYQPGQLILIDPAQGRQENAGVQLLAPVRPTPAEHIDAYGQGGPLFAYPYPLDEQWFLVSYNPTGYRPGLERRFDPGFGLYWMNAAGERELLAADSKIGCGRAVPLAPRAAGHVWPDSVDYRQAEGTYYIQDVYRGPGLRGMARGAARKIRVVALDFRAAPVGANGNSGPAGGAMSSTPPSLSQGCWDVKQVLGDADIRDDGSAFFTVPARTPVYFQVLNEHNEAIQTMRSWSTLQPGEHAACVGCHEDQNTVSPNLGQTLALATGPQTLAPFYGPRRGFSFAAEVQPTLDAKCIACHRDRAATPPAQRRTIEALVKSGEPRRLVGPAENWRLTRTEPAAGDWLTRAEPGSWPWSALPAGAPGGSGPRPRTEWRGGELWLWRSVELDEPAAYGRLQLSVRHRAVVEVLLDDQSLALLKRPAEDWEVVDLAPNFAAGRHSLWVHAVAYDEAPYLDLALGDADPGHGLRPAAPGQAFSLLAATDLDPAAKRLWSDGYLNLARATRPVPQGPWVGNPDEIVNWIPVQSAPPMLPPLTAGAAKSKLLAMLDAGHGGVKLSAAERDKLACWIDLLVPFCGDYREAAAWSGEAVRRYDHYLAKRQRLADLEWQNCLASAAETSPEQAVTVRVLDAAGQEVAKAVGQAAPDRAFSADVARIWAAGDRIVVSGPTILALSVDKAWSEGRLYAPSGRVEYRLPVGRGPRQEGRVYPPEAFTGEHHTVTVRPLARDELCEYRNLALNPLDLRGDTGFFPHATSNSECRGEPDFAARCAIDGQTRNNGHGAWPLQSWGPDQRQDLWLNLDFGRTVELDQVVLWLRADFPHDQTWETAAIEFSDGQRLPMTLRHTAERQVFPFPRHATRSLKLVDLKRPEPLGWCAITEIEAWGADCGAGLLGARTSSSAPGAAP
jgi:hypothetical protein